ncbi:hypothetical protein EX895_004643 [Sporisorium graminicola]|uniref:Uncharacterized protein n=1 Tax=Sporisorium graminicola TaxID=280036 RepID=A0A4U7KQ56_9BASI|nr:hypothetical protein EX895_004643 [Sporisorium graminicola]TKY86494.1 hypothetical protein EX895_004643 [Sporisorium graminicola]
MRTFCCCIPARLGVLVLSPVSAVAAALLAYTQLYLLINYQAQYDTFEKAIRGALAGITILLALASLFGLLGAIFARRTMVSFYSNMLWLALVIFTVLGAIEIWQLFRNKDRFVNSCETRTDLKTEDLQNFFGVSFEGQTDAACKKLADVSAVVVAVLFGILVLVLMWLIGIVTKYKHQLQERDASHGSHGYRDGYSSYGNLSKSRGGHKYHQTRDMDEAQHNAALLHTTTPPSGWKDASQPYHHSDSHATYNKA